MTTIAAGRSREGWCETVVATTHDVGALYAMRPAAETDDLFSRSDLARVFKVSAETVRRWLRTGSLPGPSLAVGKKPYWRRSQLQDVLGR